MTWHHLTALGCSFLFHHSVFVILFSFWLISTFLSSKLSILSSAMLNKETVDFLYHDFFHLAFYYSFHFFLILSVCPCMLPTFSTIYFNKLFIVILKSLCEVSHLGHYFWFCWLIYLLTVRQFFSLLFWVLFFLMHCVHCVLKNNRPWIK